MRRATFVKILVLLLLILSAGGIYAALPKASSNANWQPASRVAPSELLAQVIRENVSSTVHIDAGQMRVWRIQRSGQTVPLYWFDSRVANPAEAPPSNLLCGNSKCAFFGYIQEGSHFRRVFTSYLDPHLPPNILLFELTDDIQNGLPILKMNQLESNQIQQLTLSFNGQLYEVVETQLFPQRYE